MTDQGALQRSARAIRRTTFAQPASRAVSGIQAEAPNTLVRLDERLPGQIGQNNYLKCDISDEVLALLRSAYEESADRKTA
ncbi:hypothetical protein [Microbispora siamensis]|uniref:Chromosome partitioning protein ParB n=1 Tax=Microbispora siamensis TaxID=564413 RepID=A0ABQ4GSB5_9ACTN|nr:hypothetical protein [Microbispora siamensis]GIH64327.1 hypothetical protein Msi02_51440 [Microbispora siamensis]